MSDGNEVWEVSERTRWNDMMSGEGPRSTPTFANGKIYTLFSNGMLACIDPTNGKRIWQTKIIEKNYNKVTLRIIKHGLLIDTMMLMEVTAFTLMEN